MATMKKIFICACLKHEKETRKLAEKLEEIGFSVNYAVKGASLKNDEDIYGHNLGLIEDSDLFVAYFVCNGHYGIDFAVEVGKASGMGKQVIGFIDLHSGKISHFKDRLDKDIMFKCSFDMFAKSLSELTDFLINS
jgi:diphthamide synthase subunit DPH2